MEYDIINIIINTINTINKITHQTTCELQYIPFSFGLYQNEHLKNLLFFSDLQFGIVE